MSQPAPVATVEELLAAILQKERAALDAMEITHRPTIGAMYEGLTRDLLDKAIPVEVDLRVVSGFAVGNDGSLSRQLDCMLVRGAGEQIPYTDTWNYNLSQVLAVIEVKKNLYGADLTDGHNNLLSVADLNPQDVELRSNAPRHAFQGLTRRPWPAAGVKLPPDLDLVRALAITEAVHPVRILFGYHGFSSEANLAAAVIDHVDDLVSKGSMGLFSLPNLIANHAGAVVKLNGMPWSAPISDDGWWHVLARMPISPVRAVLELVWTRLNYLGLLPAAAFGDDREREGGIPVVSARFDHTVRGGLGGWELHAVRPARTRGATPHSGRVVVAWEPVFLTESQHNLLVLMCQQDIDVDAIPAFVGPVGQVKKDLDSLRHAGLVGPTFSTPTVWTLLTDLLRLCILPDGRFAGADDSTGRFTRWVEEFTHKHRAMKSEAAPEPRSAHEPEG